MELSMHQILSKSHNRAIFTQIGQYERSCKLDVRLDWLCSWFRRGSDTQSHFGKLKLSVNVFRLWVPHLDKEGPGSMVS